MISLKQYVGLLCRVYLGVFFLAHTAMYFVPAATEGLKPIFSHIARGGLGWQDLAISVLLGIVGAWLLAGIHSRLSATIGVALCFTPFAFHMHADLTPFAVPADRVLVLMAAAMIGIVGGGKWSLINRGWKLRDLL